MLKIEKTVKNSIDNFKNGIKIVNGQKELGNIGIIGESGDTGENGLIEFGIAITLTCSLTLLFNI